MKALLFRFAVLWSLRPSTIVVALLGLCFAINASGQIIKIEATGTIRYLSGRNINPAVSIFSKIHFSTILDESTPSFYHEYYSAGYADRYHLLNVSYDFGDVHVTQTTTRTDLMICAGYAGQWSYAFEGFTDDYGSGAALGFFFPAHFFEDTRLPLIDDFPDRVENNNQFIGFVQFDGAPYYYSGDTSWGLDSVTITRLDGAVPELSTYGIFGAVALLGMAAHKRSRKSAPARGACS